MYQDIGCTMFTVLRDWMFKKSKSSHLEKELKKLKMKTKNSMKKVADENISVSSLVSDETNKLNEKIEKLRKEIQLIRIVQEEEKQCNMIGLDSLTIHGLPRVFSSPAGILKVSWFILFLTSLFMLSLFVMDRWNYYLSQPSTISATTSYDELHFPTITICNMRDKANKSRSLEAPLAEQVHSNHSVKRTLEEAIRTATTLRPINFGDFSDGMTLISKGSDKYCIFGNEEQGCGTHLWKSISFGRKCVVFNADGNLTQKNVGKIEGLQLMLHINSDRYLSSLSYDTSTYPMDGEILVSVHHPNTMTDVWNKVYFLELGFMHEIQLARTVEIRVKNCTDRYPSIQLPGDYMYSLCLSTCLLERMYTKCGDMPQRYRQFFDYDILPKVKPQQTEMNVTDCFTEFFGGFSFANIYTTCRCKHACRSTNFESSTFSAKWLSNEKVSIMQTLLQREANLDFTEKDIRRNFTLLNVYFSSFSSVKKEESLTYDYKDLFSDVGGMMGLFCGASMFSIFELTFISIISVFNIPRWLWKKLCKSYSKISQA